MAETNVQLATIDRLVTYTPIIPPSFLPPVCVQVTGCPEIELTTIKIEANIQASITVQMCPFIQRNRETKLVPIGDSTPLQWGKSSPSNFHYEAVNNGVDTPDQSTFIIGPQPLLVDRLVFPVPSRTVTNLQSMISRCRILAGRTGTWAPQKLYVNGLLVREEAGPVWPAAGAAVNVEYEFNDLNVVGPITSVEIEIICGVWGPFQRVFEWEIDYTYT